MKFSIERASDVKQTARVLQMSGIFDVPPAKQSAVNWEVDFDLPDEWNIGLIVGPSGCGKSTIAREVFPGLVDEKYEWPVDRSILDGFPKEMTIKEITSLLSSVGFSSPPAWLRPYHVLSNGEQFRVHMARTLAERPGLAVCDEFTSVVDRQVAKVGSAAIQKTVRKRNQKFVAVSCHYDILDWLEPDWIFEPHRNVLARGRLWRRPQIALDVFRVSRSLWPLFKPHHYMSADLHVASHCFGAYWNNELVAFAAYLHFPHPKVKDIKMGHRLVVLPDYQGLGIGGMLDDWLGQYLHDQGYRYHNIVAHPAMVNYYSKSPRWKRTNPKVNVNALQVGPNSSASLTRRFLQPRRLTTYSFCYVPK